METITHDGAWCFFADPRAVYFEGTHRRTYIGWLTKEGDVIVAYYDHDSQVVEKVTLKEKLQVDDHANPALQIDEQGIVTVFYSAHNGEAMYYRIAAEPEKITAWSEEIILPVNSEGDYGYTYPNPIRLKNEDNKNYLFWRGGNFKPCFSTTTDLKTWSDPQTLLSGSGHRPYMKFASDGQRRIYFAYTDGHPNAEPHNSIYVMYYENEALYRLDGKKLQGVENLPLSPKEGQIVYDAKASGGRAWIWDIALDADNHPVLVYAVVHDRTDHRYRYARWTGSTWEDHEMTKAGKWFPQTPSNQEETEPYYSGGIALDHGNPETVFLSREINGIFEIERWHTVNQGKSWTSEAITVDSAKNNVRPIVSRSGNEANKLLIWMQGDYIQYTKYDTALRMKRI